MFGSFAFEALNLRRALSKVSNSLWSCSQPVALLPTWPGSRQLALAEDALVSVTMLLLAGLAAVVLRRQHLQMSYAGRARAVRWRGVAW